MTSYILGFLIFILMWIFVTFLYGFMVLAKKPGDYRITMFDKIMVFPFIVCMWIDELVHY